MLPKCVNVYLWSMHMWINRPVVIDKRYAWLLLASLTGWFVFLSFPGVAEGGTTVTVTASPDNVPGSLRNVMTAVAGPGDTIAFSVPEAVVASPQIGVATSGLKVSGNNGGVDLADAIASLRTGLFSNPELFLGDPDYIDLNILAPSSALLTRIRGDLPTSTSVNRLFNAASSAGNGLSLENLYLYRAGSLSPGALPTNVYGGMIYATGANLGGIAGSVFADGQIEGRYVSGGVLSVDAASSLAGIRDSVFSGNASKGIVYGGVLEANANSTLGGINNCLFNNNIVADAGTSQLNDISRGGVIAAYNYSDIGGIRNSVFANNRIDTRNLYGGLIAADNVSRVGGLYDNVFVDNIASTLGYVLGGVVGVTRTSVSLTPEGAPPSPETSNDGVVKNSGSGSDVLSSIGDIRGNLFYGTTNFAGGNIYGGVIGAVAAAQVGMISNNVFYLNSGSCSTGDYLGGVVYVGQGAIADIAIGGIVDNVFQQNTAFANEKDVYGGVILIRNHASIAAFSGNLFTDNLAVTNLGSVYGGVFAQRNGSEDLVITDSAFTNNLAVAGNGTVFGGAVFIDTAAAKANLVLSTSPGATSTFQYNRVHDGSGPNRTNAVHFGTIGGVNSTIDASLSVQTGEGGMTLLYDPVTVAMVGGNAFDMAVNGSGTLVWGGKNEFNAGPGTGLTLASGTMSLLPDYQLVTSTAGSYDVVLTGGSNLFPVLSDRPQGDALPMFRDPGSLSVTGGKVNVKALLYTLVETDAAWQVADAGYGLGDIDADFAVLPDPLFDARLEKRNGDELWIVASNKDATDIIDDNPNPNVDGLDYCGLIADAWAGAMGKLPPESVDAAYRDIVAHTERYIPEGYMTQGRVAMTWSSRMGDLFRITDYWSHRRASEEAEEEIASSEALASPAGYLYSPRPRHRAWATYIGEYARQGDKAYSGYRANLNGGMAGFALDFSQAASAGAYFAYGRGATRYAMLSTKVDTDVCQGGIFATFRPARGLSVGLDASFGWYDNAGRRENMVGVYNADFIQRIYGLGADLRYDLELPNHLRLTPFLSGRYQHLSQDGIAERGGIPDFASRIDAAGANSFVTALGGALTRDFRLAGGHTVMPGLFAAWRHEFGDRQMSAGIQYMGSPQHCLLRSFQRVRDSADLGAEIKAVVNGSADLAMEVTAGYAANLTDRYLNHTWYAGMGIRF